MLVRDENKWERILIGMKQTITVTGAKGEIASNLQEVPAILPPMAVILSPLVWPSVPGGIVASAHSVEPICFSHPCMEDCLRVQPSFFLPFLGKALIRTTKNEIFSIPKT